ncbi:MAG: ammonium transporter [Chloroflexi bacterium]|jgi:ammonium transporter, Amt family|nr:ammonium transporter [Chloroflexota bacterium]MBT5626711.1 ammonium transporter [Chloroflexota bacterium]
MDSGSVAWMLMASALVLFMTPGLAFFYGGLVRGKNVVSTVMYSFVSMGVVSVVWVLWGYSLAFGEGGQFIGNFDFVGFKDVSSDPEDGAMLFAIFQMMFAIITPALITGAIAERFKFTTYLVFLVAWITFVYAPIAHWVWAGDGWLFEMGALDFAGGTVVHINAGIAAVVAAFLVGKRRGVDRGVEPHNVPFVILGAGILWFGWFGFNAGSGLAADGLAISAFLVTNTAAAMALVVWLILGHIHTGKMSGVGAATGAVAGLVAITPASGFVGPMGAIAIGLGAGVLTFYAVRIRHKFGFDDALEVMAVHGIGGIWGAIATGIFAVGGIGLVDGDAEVLGYNVVATLATIAYSFVVTFVILKILDVIPGLGLRADDADEDAGLDVALHGERAYVGDGAD